jgi:hypothetical protein
MTCATDPRCFPASSVSLVPPLGLDNSPPPQWLFLVLPLAQARIRVGLGSRIHPLRFRLAPHWDAWLWQCVFLVRGLSAAPAQVTARQFGAIGWLSIPLGARLWCRCRHDDAGRSLITWDVDSKGGLLPGAGPSGSRMQTRYLRPEDFPLFWYQRVGHGQESRLAAHTSSANRHCIRSRTANISTMATPKATPKVRVPSQPNNQPG